MNLVFHIFAAIAFIGLGYMIVVLQKRNKYLQNILQFSQLKKSEKIVVDWPIKFILELAQSLEITIENPESISKKLKEPMRIEAEKFYQFVLQHKITSIHFRKDQDLCIQFDVKADMDQTEIEEQQLAQAIGINCKINKV